MSLSARARPLSVASALMLLTFACGAEKDAGTSSGTFSGDSGTGVADTSRGGADGAVTDEDSGLNLVDVKPPETVVSTCTGADPDCDGDGYKVSEDCNDKDGTINPDAYDFEGDDVDNDCDGTKDNPVKECDPAVGSKTLVDFARAIELCPQRSISKKTPGKPFDPVALVEFGKIGNLFGSSQTSHANTQIISQFGDNLPRASQRLVGLQSGPLLHTNPRGQSGGGEVLNACAAIGLTGDDCKSLASGSAMSGSPLDAFSLSAGDYQEVKITIRVPSNAKGMAFDFAFFSSEFNQYWQSPYNDSFFALVKSKRLAMKNVAKDDKGFAVTVNSGFFQLCPKPGTLPSLSSTKSAALSSAPCVGADGDPAAKVFGTLKGTYFDGAGIGSTDGTIGAAPSDAGTDGGGTDGGVSGGAYVYGGGSGWLTSKFEVEPGEQIILRFIVLDTGDTNLDSAAIVDNIRWDKAPPKVPTGGVERPPM